MLQFSISIQSTVYLALKLIPVKNTFLVLIFLFVGQHLFAQTTPIPNQPKLVVGIVVDQMRYDFLYRYYTKYSEGGFKRLMTQGFNCKNVQFNYIPTYTGPGHASIYTGSVPAINGIVSNDWYDRETNSTVYVTSDANYKTVGADNLSGNMSPQRMLTTTITDQLRLSNNFQSKVIGISLKDRGAILPAGHTGNAAYWLDGLTGNWISSSFYIDELPKWVTDINAEQQPKKYLSQNWNTMLPIEQYTESTIDSIQYESSLPSDTKPIFPHHLSDSTWVKYDLVKYTPFGNTLLKDFAISTIKNEKFGKGTATDFLSVSFSSTDYVGHLFGPNSIESEDTYLRLDKDLADFFSFLDTWVGKNNYLIFLTADHGVAPVPGLANDYRIPAGVINEVSLLDSMKIILNNTFGDTGIILAYENQQLYLDHSILYHKNISIEGVLKWIQPLLNRQKGYYNSFVIEDLNSTTMPDHLKSVLNNSFLPKRSGDIMILYDPYWFGGRIKGTTHGAIFSYDTHVPLLWYGWKIKTGETGTLNHITDIAPTLSYLLNVQEPNGNVGVVIDFNK